MTGQRTCVLWILIVLIALGPAASGQGLPTASPKSVGLSQERLDRITAVMRQRVEDGLLAGAVTLVARDGKVAYLQSVGMQDKEQKIEMSPGTVFRIASMSKPVTSVAVMMLYEAGRFQLKDPISKFIPEFKSPKVIVTSQGSQEQLVPANREITIRHLLTQTSGLTYQWDPRVGQKYKEAGITHGLIQDEGVLADGMKKLGQMPLVHQPGEAWNYGLSTDVLGRLVEVVSGMSYDEFLRTHLSAAANEGHLFLPPAGEGRQDGRRLRARPERAAEAAGQRDVQQWAVCLHGDVSRMRGRAGTSPGAAGCARRSWTTPGSPRCS